MPLLPPSRWFRLKLSTWFVLVAILAWAMMQRPWVVTQSAPGPGGVFIQGADGPGGPLEIISPVKEVRSLNPNLIYPAFALAAFVGWKAAWLIGRRVAERKVEQV